MNLRDWRLNMQKLLIEIERVENIKGNPINNIPEAVIVGISNLTRDLQIQRGWK